MKAINYEHDFRVHVRSEVLDQPSDVADYFDGIFSVILNHLPSVHVVPPFERQPWPPVLPENIDIVHSRDEARRLIISMATYVVTADDARAGTEEVMPQEPLSPGGPPEHAVVFYISRLELDPLLEELDELSDRFMGVNDTIPVSTIASSLIAQILLTRVVASPNMRSDHLRILGR